MVAGIKTILWIMAILRGVYGVVGPTLYQVVRSSADATHHLRKAFIKARTDEGGGVCDHSGKVSPTVMLIFARQK